MQIDTIVDEAGFDDLRGEWDHLLGISRQNGPFLRFDWLRAWWDSFKGEGQLRILTCRDGNDLVGAFPLFTVRSGRIVRADAVRLLADSDVGSTGLGPLAEPGAEEQVVEGFVNHLSLYESPWDVLDLRFIDPKHTLYKRLTTKTLGARVTDQCGVCPQITLPGDWEEYLKTLSKHMRHEVRRSTRRARERGLEFEMVRAREDLPAAIGDFHRLNESRMREKFGDSFALTDEYRSFSARAMRDLFDEGALRLWFIKRGAERLAVLYQLRHADTIYALRSGFLGDGRQDAQRALWGESIRSAIEEGCTRVDMLLGDQRYKHEWGANEVRELARVRLYNRTVTGAARNGRDAAADWLQRRTTDRPAEARGAAR